MLLNFVINFVKCKKKEGKDSKGKVCVNFKTRTKKNRKYKYNY